jgi:nucleoside-diphosphate-sugar epimerase
MRSWVAIRGRIARFGHRYYGLRWTYTCDVLAKSGYLVRATLRTDRLVPGCVAEKIAVGSLAVDITHTRRELGWSPPVSVDEGLARTSTWYFAELLRRGG